MAEAKGGRAGLTSSTSTGRLFKIHTAELWEASAAALAWAPIDLQDGYMHLSTDLQVVETAMAHFAGQQGLWLLEIDGPALADLRFEPSRGGDLFPHVYGDVPREAVVASWELPWDPVSQSFIWPRAAGLG